MLLKVRTGVHCWTIGCLGSRFTGVQAARLSVRACQDVPGLVQGPTQGNQTPGRLGPYLAVAHSGSCIFVLVLFSVAPVGAGNCLAVYVAGVSVLPVWEGGEGAAAFA